MRSLDEIATGFIEAKILLTAAELRVFDHLRGTGASVQELRERTGGTRRGIEILLDALVAMKIVAKEGERYRNVPEHESRLVEDAPDQLPAMLRHRNRMFRYWAFLEERVTGRPIPLPERSGVSDPQANESFIRAMYFASGALAREVADRVDLGGVRTLADMGGGPGHYLAEFARRSPGIEPWLVDLPLTIEVARRMGLDRDGSRSFRHVAWDFYREPAPPDLPAFDLVFLSQVVHAESPEANRELFRKISERLSPGGRLVVHERLVDRGRTSPREAALFAVNMLAMTLEGRTYTEDEIAEWGEGAGLRFTGGESVSERSQLVRFEKPAHGRGA